MDYITLPNDTIVDRLCTVTCEQWICEGFFPLIAEYSGRELNAFGIGVMFGRAIQKLESGGLESGLVYCLQMLVPQMIRALVISRDAELEIVDAEEWSIAEDAITEFSKIVEITV